jgi:hypothetical protein
MVFRDFTRERTAAELSRDSVASWKASARLASSRNRPSKKHADG